MGHRPPTTPTKTQIFTLFQCLRHGFKSTSIIQTGSSYHFLIAIFLIEPGVHPPFCLPVQYMNKYIHDLSLLSDSKFSPPALGNTADLCEPLLTHRAHFLRRTPSRSSPRRQSYAGLPPGHGQVDRDGNLTHSSPNEIFLMIFLMPCFHTFFFFLNKGSSILTF